VGGSVNRQGFAVPVDRPDIGQWELWVLAVCFYVVGDSVTTVLGLGTPGISEAGPVAAVFLHEFGFSSLIALKMGIVGGGYALWTVLRGSHRRTIPLALATVGVVATLWNLYTLVSVVVV